jgi:hypothetical protein
MLTLTLTYALSLAGLVACGGADVDVIAPSTPDGFAAVHFDSLLGSACQGSGRVTAGVVRPLADLGVFITRCQFLVSFALPLAFGAAASPIAVDAGTGPINWQAFVFDSVDSNKSGQVSESFTFMAFNDTNVVAGFEIGPNGDVFLYSSIGTLGASSSNTGYTVGDSLAACATPPTLRHTSVPTLGAGTSCSGARST